MLAQKNFTQQNTSMNNTQDDRKIRPMRRDNFFIFVYALAALMFVLQFVIIFGINS